MTTHLRWDGPQTEASFKKQTVMVPALFVGGAALAAAAGYVAFPKPPLSMFPYTTMIAGLLCAFVAGYTSARRRARWRSRGGGELFVDADGIAISAFLLDPFPPDNWGPQADKQPDGLLRLRWSAIDRVNVGPPTTPQPRRPLMVPACPVQIEMRVGPAVGLMFGNLGADQGRILAALADHTKVVGKLPPG